MANTTFESVILAHWSWSPAATSRLKRGVLMHPVREKMNRALKVIAVAELRQLEFKGSFPHFRRLSGIFLEI